MARPINTSALYLGECDHCKKQNHLRGVHIFGDGPTMPLVCFDCWVLLKKLIMDWCGKTEGKPEEIKPLE